MFGVYHSLSQTDDYFFKSIGTTLDQYHQTSEKILLLGDFYGENAEPSSSEFLEQYAENI